MPDDRIKAAIDDAANSLAVAVLLASCLGNEHADLRRAVERAARALAALQPSGEK